MYILIILSFISLSFSQFSTNFLNGFGNNRDVISTFSESMGEMWMNNSNRNNWDPLLASSLYSSDLTKICVSSSITGNQSDFYKTYNQNFEFINFSFPIYKNMGLGIGFSPNTVANYVFEEDPVRISGTEFSHPLLSTSSHVIKGGISELSLSLSRGFIFKNSTLALGFKWNILFGNQQINSVSNLQKVTYDQSGNEILTLIEDLYNDEYNSFNAYQYEFDSRIIINDKNSISLLMTLTDDFEINNNKVHQLFSSSDKYFMDQVQLDRLGFGYMYNIDDNLGIASELHFKNSIDIPFELMLFDSPSPTKISFHNGLYKRFYNMQSESWNSINLSVGCKYKIIKFKNRDLRDISCSFGSGILFNDLKNNIDISLTIGLVENIMESIGYDSYYKINIAFFSGDKWFKKRRRN